MILEQKKKLDTYNVGTGSLREIQFKENKIFIPYIQLKKKIELQTSKRLARI
jgi:hypothetical protein